jgi:hypothetical protein
MIAPQISILKDESKDKKEKRTSTTSARVSITTGGIIFNTGHSHSQETKEQRPKVR